MVALTARLLTEVPYTSPQKRKHSSPRMIHPSVESGSYCRGVDWETGNVITCWKNNRGVMVRNPRHNVDNNEKLLLVTYLTYETSSGDEILYEVDRRGKYAGHDRDLFDEVQDIPIPERYSFNCGVPTRRKLSALPETSSRGANLLGAVDAVVKTEDQDAGDALSGTTEFPSVQIKPEDHSPEQDRDATTPETC